MNTYDITWHDSGNAIYRNSVQEDPRPTEVTAHSYSTLYAGESPCALAFYNENNDEAFLILFDIPLMIKRRNG